MLVDEFVYFRHNRLSVVLAILLVLITFGNTVTLLYHNCIVVNKLICTNKGKKRWFSPLTVSLKRLTKYPQTKLKKQLTLGINILTANLKNNIMAKKAALKSYSLAEMKDKYIGKTGTADWD